MKLKNFFKIPFFKNSKNKSNKNNKNIIDIDLSETCPSTYRRQSYIDWLICKNETQLAATTAIKYFFMCAPLFDGIDRISQAISEIKPLVYDMRLKKFILDHPLNKLLQKPNYTMNGAEFMYAISTFMLLTGNNYMFGDGINKNKPPMQLFLRPPQAVDYFLGTDGQINSYTVQLMNKLTQYQKIVDINYGFRYINETNNITSELFHFKNFNPDCTLFNLKGNSVLNSIYYEIEQYIASGRHNLSLLKRGTTISGVFFSEDDLSDNAFEQLKAQINEYYSGDQNAGRPFLAVGGLKFQPNQQSNKDMDFNALTKNVTATIYNILRIPLPLIASDTMTLANLEASMTIFYKNGVLPLVKRIYANLTQALLSKYPNSENLIIWYNANDIPALESEIIENVNKKKDLGVLTANELRDELGRDPLNGGDDLYQPASNVPYASKTNDILDVQDNKPDESNKPKIDQNKQPSDDEQGSNDA